MKKNLKILTLSVFITLTCLALQTAHSTEEFSEPGEYGVKQPPVPRVSGSPDTEDFQQRCEETRKNPFVECPEEITFIILELTAISNYLSDGNTGSLILVCRDWRHMMEQEKMKKSIASIKDEQIYQRFLKGGLVYRPNQGSDVGRIDLPIASLVDPLDGTFDLSQCGNTDKYLSISTGYRKGKKAENANKVEVWLTPRFLVEKEINGSAQHYQEIFPSQWSEKAPIGIFWSWGDWENMRWYDYLTTNTIDELADDNLYKKWCARSRMDETTSNPPYFRSPYLHFRYADPGRQPEILLGFHVHFMS